MHIFLHWVQVQMHFVNYDCHGMGVLEIKYPEKYMNSLFNWQKDKKVAVTKTYKIKRNHPYFYQMQMQAELL